MSIRELPVRLRWAIVFVVIWDLTWKGLALWRAARRAQIGWFISLLITHTGGALPLYYLWPKNLEKNREKNLEKNLDKNNNKQRDDQNDEA